ncbi:ribonuclease III [Natranaerobius trueperi]|uniref:Ribonuclease 3 n=1 Tax=Natranaerobius trueperi TaxID=759412 RepID=A0A226BZ40_9FIRM|nr:ribonuclease III [Natranaerobius trueperi]OWZ84195.1 ribonuclease III [Natranaerobius trueperi]
MAVEHYSVNNLRENLEIEVDDSLLLQAVTHTSYAHEQRKSVIHNERLEFLGDAVLELAISEALYKKHSELPEGELTKIRAELVCEPSLVKIAHKLELGLYLRLGKGEENTGGRKRPSILADTVEAVLGAVFLSQGYDSTKTVIYQLFQDQISDISNKHIGDYKTVVQELTQEKFSQIPQYHIVDEVGPDHDKQFIAEVYLDEKLIGRGKGKSKKVAEQNAAHTALNKLTDE